MRFAVHFLGLSLVLGSLACGSSSSTTISVLRPELIAISPADFLGSLRCLAEGDQDLAEPGEGGIGSYVATLVDVTPVGDAGVPDPGVPVLSSPATPCQQVLTFSAPPVIALHAYIVEVDAFQAVASTLEPVEPATSDHPGTRAQKRVSDGVVIPAQWVATCGGYPASPAASALEASRGGGAGTAGTSPVAASDGGNAGTAPATATAGSTGVVAYDTLTRTPHNCGRGLEKVPTAK